MVPIRTEAIRNQLLDDWGDSNPSELLEAVAQRIQAGLPVIDLITSNPHEEGFLFPSDILQQALLEGVRRSQVNRPDARGQLAAREAISRYHGSVSPDNVILTPGSSLAYWYVFRLLCNGGGEILCPSPTYPLFDDLARLAGARVRRYHLSAPADGDNHWSIDPQELEFQITSETRAIVIVSPHNPTGSVASSAELEAVADIARRHNLAVIFDEVFREFTMADAASGFSTSPRPFQFNAPLTFTLNGLSKMLYLPGLKAGWMVVEGDETKTRHVLNALEYMSDTFLPVSEPVQAAIPRLFEVAQDEVTRFRMMLQQRMRACESIWQERSLAATIPEASPYLLIRMNEADNLLDAELRTETITGEPGIKLALKFLEKTSMLLHPGSLYSLSDRYLVSMCYRLPEPEK